MSTRPRHLTKFFRHLIDKQGDRTILIYLICVNVKKIPLICGIFFVEHIFINLLQPPVEFKAENSLSSRLMRLQLQSDEAASGPITLTSAAYL